MTTEARAVVVDTDLSVDDIVALAYVLRQPTLDVQAVTVSGTGLAHCGPGLRVVRSITNAMGGGDVRIGCGRTSVGSLGHPFPEPWRTGADNGYGIDFPLVRVGDLGDTTDAPTLIADLAASADGGLTILSLGPMTNVADALSQPGVAAHVRQIVAMAGAVRTDGNVFVDGSSAPLRAEWNVYADPESAGEVFASGVPITLVPLDATNSVPVNQALVDELARDHSAAGADIATELFARYGVRQGDYLWDALAAVALADPGVVSTQELHLEVDVATGALAEDANAQLLDVALSADRAAFEAQLLQGLRIGGQRSNPFVIVGKVALDFAGDQCAAGAKPDLAAGKWTLSAATTEAAPVMFALVRLHPGWTRDDLARYVASAADPSSAPPFIDVVSTIALDGPGSATAIVDLTPDVYAAACLAQRDAGVDTVLAPGVLMVPAS